MPANIGRDDVQKLVGEGAQLVEVLPPEEYKAMHLPGAINISVKILSRETTAQLDRDRPVIVY